MKIETIGVRNEEVQVVRAVGDVTEAEPRTIPYGRTQRWVPKTIEVTWERSRVNGGDWSPWAVKIANVRGPKVRKDGSPYAGGDTQLDRLWLHRTGDEQWGPWIESTRPKDGGLPVPMRREPGETVDLDA